MHLTSRSRIRRPAGIAPVRGEAGFTLIELLVTLVIVSVGLLGVAKLQAAAVAETTVARTRSLMTYQAQAIAAAMRSNRAYWQGTTAYTVTFKNDGTWVAASGMTAPGGTGTCVSVSTCSAGNLAYDDMNTWYTSFHARFPAATGTVGCTAGSATVPESCDITLSWDERTVAINRTTAAGTSSSTGTIVLHVQP